MQTVFMTAAAFRGRVLALDRIDGFAAARATAMHSRGTVTVTRWRPGDAHGFNVAVIVPQTLESDESIVFPMSYDYRVEPLLLRRLEVIAAVTGRRLVAVETPGVTVNFDEPSRTTRALVGGAAFRAGITGNYSGLATLQFQALHDVANVDPSTSRYLGESLGAQSVMSMSLQAAPLSLDLVEPVNCLPMGLAALMRMGRSLVEIEEPLRSRYVARSKSSGWDTPDVFEKSSDENERIDRRLKRFWSQGRWAALSAVAMRRGLLALARQVDPTTPVRVWRGADSTACLAADVSQFVEQLGSTADWATLQIDGMPAGHHVLTELDAATGFALELRRQWAPGATR